MPRTKLIFLIMDQMLASIRTRPRYRHQSGSVVEGIHTTKEFFLNPVNQYALGDGLIGGLVEVEVLPLVPGKRIVQRSAN